MLCGPRDDANIGAVARAIKNCGLKDLWLVRRRKPGKRARATAVHADDVLDCARHTATLAQALEGCTHAVGFTARPRRFAPKLELFDASAARELAAVASRGNVALVFGNERSGLSDDEAMLCSRLFRLPASGERPIYNLSQAVLLVTFTIAFPAQPRARRSVAARTSSALPREALESLRREFESLVSLLGYPPPRTPHDRTSRILVRLRRQLERACEEPADAALWRGLLSRIRSRLS